MKPLPLRLWDRGYRALVSVIPPGAPLAPNSTIPVSQLGKVPGRKLASGVWAGYGWLKHNPTEADVRQWTQNGANIGILAAGYPGVDCDSSLEWINDTVAALAIAYLGWAPIRYGRAEGKRRTLMYRTGMPFSRVAAVIHLDGVEHLVEVLGAGRQYLIDGQHPLGPRYTWDTPLDTLDPEKGLTWITREDVLAFFAAVQETFEVLGADVTLAGDGTIRERDAGARGDLIAPSIEALRECVAAIPNADDLFPTRDDYIKMGYAIRAAAGDAEEEGYEVFAEWAARHEKDGRVAGNPETWRADWRRMRPPYAVGWTWLAELAAPHGFNAATFEFAADPTAVIEVVREREETPPEWSDLWLAHHVIEEHGQRVRYLPESDQFRVYEGSHWQRDAVLKAEHLVKSSLSRLAHLIEGRGATDQEKANWQKLASRLCSAKVHRDVLHQLRSDPRITATADVFDQDPYILNTPGGIVDLRTGAIREHDPNALCSRVTKVTPDFEMPSPLWDRFLMEATGGDLDRIAYMRRLSGYTATALTSEQVFAFLYGRTQTGKGTFYNAVVNILATYHEAAGMDTFTSTRWDQHPTDLAKLAGARLVTSVETQEGRKWNEQRIKTVTGGDPVTARFMRQDFFTFRPLFKLWVIGNVEPEIRDIGNAMRRRMHVVPFPNYADPPDLALGKKLEAEYPAILAWMVRGAVEWFTRGLLPPESVLAATAEYFTRQDSVARWIEERCEQVEEFETSTAELYQSWAEWARERGESPGTIRSFTQLVATKGFERTRDPVTRRVGFRGLRVVDLLSTEGI